MTTETSYLEVSKPGGLEVVLLERERVTIGRGAGNDVVLEYDLTVSSLHAVIQSYADGWTVRDLGSRNGTVVCGERLLAERALRHGDELRVGNTRIVFRSPSPAGIPLTSAPRRPPELTRRERDVLIALCRPLFGSDMFRQPAPVRDIAAQLVVTEAAVKQHLGRLYDKFELVAAARGRLELANEAVRRGAVTPADLRPLG